MVGSVSTKCARKGKRAPRTSMPTATVEEIEEFKRHRHVKAAAAGKILGMHPDTVTRLARNNKLNCRCSHNAGGDWIFRTEDLLKLADGEL